MSIEKFKKAQADLNQQVADLSAKVAALIGEIQKSEVHFSGFASLKRTHFALEKIAKKTGNQPTKKRASASKPNHAIFERKAVNTDAAAPRSANKPKKAPKNIFDRAANLSAANAAAKAQGVGKKDADKPKRNIPDLFNRSKNPTLSPPPAKKKREAKPVERAQVLATSEETED